MATPTPKVVLTPELKYKPVEYRHGTKVWSQVVQQTGGNSIFVPVASTAESIFEIPSKALYMSDSFIRGLSTPFGVAADDSTNWYHANQHFVSEIHLTTRSNVPIVTLYNADKYRALTRGWHVPFDELMTSDTLDRFRPSRGTGATPLVGARVPTVAATPVPASAPYTETQYLEAGTIAGATPVIPFTIRLR